jgi:hypothetical protein
MSYGFRRRGAHMIANSLRGTKAGDIPMEQPTTCELAINLKKVKASASRYPSQCCCAPTG